MAKTLKTASEKKTDEKVDKKPFAVTRQQKIIFGCLIVLFAIAMLLSFVSFFIYGQEDQSAVNAIGDRSEVVQNWLGKFGAFVANIFIYKGFGAASFLLVRLFFLTGAFLVLDISMKKLKNSWFWDLFVMIIISVLLGFYATSLPELGGTIGFEMNSFLQDYVGKIGTILILILGLLTYLVFKLGITPEGIKLFVDKRKKDISDDLKSVHTETEKGKYNLEEFAIDDFDDEPVLKKPSQFEINKEDLKPTISNASNINMEPTLKVTPLEIEPSAIAMEVAIAEPEVYVHREEVLEIAKVEEEDFIEDNLASRLVADFGLFDPRLDLSGFKFPTLDLLKEYNTGGITINQQELEENKNRIVETLRTYKIEIAHIKATVGPDRKSVV